PQLRELLAAVAVAGGRKGPRVRRVERDTVHAVAAADHQAGGFLEVDVRLVGGLTPVGGGVEVVRPRGDLSAGTRVDPVVQTEVQGTRESTRALLLELVEDTELVLLVRPLELIGGAELHDRLMGDRDDRAGGSVVRALLRVLLNELGGQILIERDDRGLAEPHRLLPRQGSDGRTGLRLLNDPVCDVLRQSEIAAADNSHDLALSWV